MSANESTAKRLIEEMDDRTAAPQCAPPREREHYELLKRLEGESRDDWLYDWVYENGISCYFCGNDVDLSNFEAHHKDKAHVPLNARENTALSHPNCNRSYRELEVANRTAAPQVPRERESLPQGFPAEYSAQEGRDHKSMRKNWNDWTRGRRPMKYPVLEDLKRGKRDWYRAKDIALRAASACQDPEDEVQHSSKTYQTYIEEDIFEGLYDSKMSKGALTVRVSDFFMDILLEIGVLVPHAVSLSETEARAPQGGR